MAVSVEPAVAAQIVAQLGTLVATGKWLRPRLPGTMRGIDFYPARDFIAALAVSAQLFKNAHGVLPSLAAPTTFNEHLFLYKFFAPLPLPSLADKLAARAYVQARVGGDILPELVWVGDRIGPLFATPLPPGRYVLKANHGSGWNLILSLPGDLAARRGEIEKSAAGWLGARFGYDMGEWHYAPIKPLLFLESFITFKPGSAPDDYKIFCIRGKARVIHVHMDRDTHRRCGMYDVHWRHLPYAVGGYEIGRRRRPDNLEELIGVAEKIAAELEFARVDLYTDGKRIIKFGEITLTPGNALTVYADAYERWLGAFFAADAGAPAAAGPPLDPPSGIE
jgi:TupA-like ATPgrasp